MNCLSRFLYTNNNNNSKSPNSASTMTPRNGTVQEQEEGLSPNLFATQNHNNSITQNNINTDGDHNSTTSSNISLEILSPPALTSTPSLQDRPTNCKRRRQFSFTNLPDVVLDKIFPLLSDEDLRSVCQVSNSWKAALQNRPRVERRRQELVLKIQKNKENIYKGSKDLSRTDVNRSRVDRDSAGKPGSRQILNECNNNLTALSANSTSSNRGNDTGPKDSSTPTSRFAFQRFEEAEKNLRPGQKLFQCNRCYGPVASPVVPSPDSKEYNNNRANATRCRLTTRMENLIKRKPGGRERKKPKTLDASVDDGTRESTTHAYTELGEKMSRSLVITSPRPSWDSGDKKIIEAGKTQASVLCTGIDLPISMTYNTTSSVNCNFNISDSSFDMSTSTSSIFPMSSSNNLKMNCSVNVDNDSGFSLNTGYSDEDVDSNDSFIIDYSIHSLLMANESIGHNDNIAHRSVSGSQESCNEYYSDSLLNLDVSHNVKNRFNNCNNVQEQQDADDIHQSTYESHRESIYDISSTNDREVNVHENSYNNDAIINQSYLPVLENQTQNTSQSKSLFGYSNTGSVLRDYSKNCSSFWNSLASPNNLKLQISLDDSNKSKFLGFGDNGVMDQNLFESSLNCPTMNESMVLECPDCSYRFCTSCQFGEHPGKPCRVIDSDALLSETSDDQISLLGSFNIISPPVDFKCNSSMGKGKGKGTAEKDKTQKKKSSLRRIAKL